MKRIEREVLKTYFLEPTPQKIRIIVEKKHTTIIAPYGNSTKEYVVLNSEYPEFKKAIKGSELDLLKALSILF